MLEPFNFQLQPKTDDATHDPGSQLDTELSAVGVFDGIAKLPPGFVVLARNGVEVERVALDDQRVRALVISDSLTTSITFLRMKPGWYEAYFEFGGAQSRHAYAVVGFVPATGQKRMTFGGGYSGPLFGRRDDSIWFQTYAALPRDDFASIFRIEWWHDGARVSSKDELVANEHMVARDGTAAWEMRPLNLDMPEGRRTGQWEVRYLPMTGDGFSARISLDGNPFADRSVVRIDGVDHLPVTPTKVATDEKVKKELAAALDEQRPALGAYFPSSAEARGWTRSPELFAARKDFVSKTTPVGVGRIIWRDRLAGESVEQHIKAYDAFEKHVHDKAAQDQLRKAAVAKSLFKELKKLTAQHGAPWTENEHPVPGGDTPVVMQRTALKKGRSLVADGLAPASPP